MDDLKMQKQTLKKAYKKTKRKHITPWKILAIICAVVMIVSIPLSILLQKFDNTMAARFGGSFWKLQNEDANAQYYTSDFNSAEEMVNYGLALTQQVEAEGAALLMNNNNALPLAADAKVSTFSSSSVNLVYGGTGSGNIDASTADTLRTALEKVGVTVNPTLWDFYTVGAGKDYARSKSGTVAKSSEVTAEVPWDVYTDEVKDSVAQYGDAAIVTLSRVGGEGADLSYGEVNYLALDENEKAMLQNVAEMKKNGTVKKTILLINSANALQVDFLKNNEYDIDAALWIGDVGISGINAVAEILTGKVNPSGSLVDTYCYDNFSAPAMWNFTPTTYEGYVEGGDVSAKAKSYMIYQEGIYVGYKYYETRYFDTVMGQGNAASTVGSSTGSAWNYDDEVTYPFGYGLSYTTFEQTLDNLNVDLENETVTANVTVKNTGSVAGKDVVQLYVSLPYTDYDKEHGVEKAAIQLLDYGKTAELAPGASETVTITADMQNMASWDSTADNAVGTKGCYILDAGDYYFTIGNGAHEAVNNVLAAEGQSVDGSADKAKSWTLDSFDDTTFATTKNGTAVENQLADMDINSWLPGTATYMTRSDWEGTFPKTYKNLTASDEMLDILDNDIYEINANGDPSTVTFGADNGLTLADLKGVTDLDDERWSLLMDQLTLEEGMIRLGLGGTSTKAIESIMSPETIQNDGPNGIYSYPLGQYANTDKAGTDPCAVDANAPNLAYKFGTMVNETVIAQTFNKDLANEYGKICGNYSLWSNLTIFWGCGTNLHRSPYNARNHEYYSEDAVLTSGQAVAFISGGKEYGVIIAPKHLAFNDTEINRTGVSVFMTEQQARENELRGTQAAIEDAGALGVMTAFNRVGITATNAHTGLLKNILRGEWGFKGLESQDFIMNPNYAVLKEYALNGGTMTTFTGENTMAAVSEKFAYWTTENVGQDTELMSAIKQAMTWQAYALANSNALDGMASSTRLVSVRTWYDNALVAVQVVFAALTVLAAAMYVLNDRKSKKQ